jgi:hypothetical protein
VQINDELDVHSGLLEELDTDIDRTHSRLGGARRRLDRVARGAKENSEWDFFFFLVVALGLKGCVGSAVAIGLIIFVLLILIVVFKT